MTQTMTKSQERIVNKVKQYCADAEVMQSEQENRAGLLFIRWTNNEDHLMLKENYMAKIGPRGALKIISVHRYCADDKMKKTLAHLCLYQMKIRGTIKIN